MIYKLNLLFLISTLVVPLSRGFLSANAVAVRSPASLLKQQQHHHHQQQQPHWAKDDKKSTSTDPIDLKELKHRINRVTNPYYELFAATEVWNVVEDRPDHVYIVIFKPDTAEQGFHSIEYPKGSGSNFVLAFQSYQSCNRFTKALSKAQQQQFDACIVPQRFELDFLENMCDSLGVFVQIVPRDLDIIPPTHNVQNLGQHHHNLRDEKNHLDYLFDMFDMDEVEELGLAVDEDSEFAKGSWQ